MGPARPVYELLVRRHAPWAPSPDIAGNATRWYPGRWRKGVDWSPLVDVSLPRLASTMGSWTLPVTIPDASYVRSRAERAAARITHRYSEGRSKLRLSGLPSLGGGTRVPTILKEASTPEGRQIGMGPVRPAPSTSYWNACTLLGPLPQTLPAMPRVAVPARGIPDAGGKGWTGVPSSLLASPG